MEKQILKLTIGILSILITAYLGACAPKNTDTVDYALDTYTALQDNFTTRTNDKLVGSGDVIFTAVTTGVNSKQSFRFSFRLPAEGSKVTLISNSADSVTLTQGVRIEFSRVSGNVKGNIQINDGTPVEIDPVQLMVFNPEKVELILEVHNLSPVRVFFWWASASEFTAELADFDSNSNLLGNLGVATGPGARWGLSLSNAEVSRAQLREPKIP